MNKKAFTLVEMLFIVVLIGIIATIVFPNIMDAVKQSKIDEYENTAKILRQSLELYNQDYKEDLWSDENQNVYKPSLNDLQSVNPSLKINGKCSVQSDGLQITKNDTQFQYQVHIVCDGYEINDFHNSGNN